MFGLPNLLRKAPQAIAITLLGNNVSRLMDFLFPAPNWGVFLPGTTTPAFVVSSVAELDIGAETAISDYPIETGAFATYNKVIMPNAFSLRLTRDGSETQRAAFLNWLEVVRQSLDLFDVLCPERTYRNVTLKSYRVTRTSESGAAMIVADCIFQEIRQTPAIYSNSQIPAPANQSPTPTVRVTPVPDQTILQGFPI